MELNNIKKIAVKVTTQSNSPPGLAIVSTKGKVHHNIFIFEDTNELPQEHADHVLRLDGHLVYYRP